MNLYTELSRASREYNLKTDISLKESEELVDEVKLESTEETEVIEEPKDDVVIEESEGDAVIEETTEEPEVTTEETVEEPEVNLTEGENGLAIEIAAIEEVLRGLEDEISNTNDEEEKQAIQKEIDELRAELNSIDGTLLDGETPVISGDGIAEITSEIEDVATEEVPNPIEKLTELVTSLTEEGNESNEYIITTLNEVISLLEQPESPAEEVIDETIEECDKTLDESGEETNTGDKERIDYLLKKEEVCPLDKEERFELAELLSKVGDLEESEEETFTECEVKSFRVTRVAPSVDATLLEAETVEGLKYIVGKEFNKDTKTLVEAEIFDKKEDASNHFASLLGKK